MYRRGIRFPGWVIARIGTVGDQDLHDSVLKPRFELFAANKAEWLPHVDVCIDKPFPTGWRNRRVDIVVGPRKLKWEQNPRIQDLVARHLNLRPYP